MIEVQITVEPEGKPSGLVGKLFKAGGRRGVKTAFWLVVSHHKGYCHMLGLNMHGEIVSTASYGDFYVHGKPTVAMIDLSQVQFLPN